MISSLASWPFVGVGLGGRLAGAWRLGGVLPLPFAFVGALPFGPGLPGERFTGALPFAFVGARLAGAFALALGAAFGAARVDRLAGAFVAWRFGAWRLTGGGLGAGFGGAFVAAAFFAGAFLAALTTFPPCFTGLVCLFFFPIGDPP